eukprot:1164232-Prorocentrum_minimum.AAC.1
MSRLIHTRPPPNNPPTGSFCGNTPAWLAYDWSIAVELTPEEKAKAKRERIGWIVAYVVATVMTSVTGNDAPFFLLMFMQLFRQSPDKLLQ